MTLKRSFVLIPLGAALTASLGGCIKDGEYGSRTGADKVPIVLTQAGVQSVRGMEIPDGQLSDGTEFSVTAYYYPAGELPANGTRMSWNGYSIIDGRSVETNARPLENVSYKVVSGKFVSQVSTPFYWPQGTDDKLLFYAYMPKVSEIHSTAELIPYFGQSPNDYLGMMYKLPGEVADHHDLLVATTGKLSPGGGETMLNFRHTLTRIEFLARRSDMLDGKKVVVSDIVIRDALGRAYMNIDPGNSETPFRWVDNEPGQYMRDLSLSSAGEKAVLNYNYDLNEEHQSLMRGEGSGKQYVMAIPMNGSNAERALFDAMEVDVTAEINGVERKFTLPLAGTERWAPGKKMTYLFTIYPEQIDWDWLVEDWEGPEEIEPDLSKVLLEVSRTRAAINEHNKARIWFRTNQSEVTLEPEKTNDLVSIVDWDLVADDLTGGNPRNFQYWRDEASGLYIGYVDIETDRKREMVGSGEGFGTFFINAGGLRRKITIDWENVPDEEMPLWCDYPYVGAFWRHDQVGERLICGRLDDVDFHDWIAEVVDGDFIVLEKGKTLDENVWTNREPGDAENFPVQDGMTNISGKGNIYFRIGLKGTIGENEVRYGRVNVSVTYYNKDREEFDIYIRQGEAPNCVMGNQYLFSPYNLTAGDNGPGEGTGVELGPRGGSFTEYPSQTGYYFRWDGTMGYPWTGYISSWPIYTGQQEWKESFDACPEGYRRPEIEAFQMSVVPHYPDVPPVPERLALKGYYADGYFDRRMIDGSDNTMLGTGDACQGILFYESQNEPNLRSIFFPNGGLRTNDIYNRGTYGFYWASSYHGNSMFSVFESSNAVGPYSCYSGHYNGEHGIPIRCIRE